MTASQTRRRPRSKDAKLSHGLAASLIQPNGQNETVARGPPFRSPSRFRFRPPDPLTFGFRLLPPVPASTYLRSVLGASGNLGEDLAPGKRSDIRKARNLQEFNYPHFHSRPCSLWKPPLSPRLESCRCRMCLARLRSTTASSRSYGRSALALSSTSARSPSVSRAGRHSSSRPSAPAPSSSSSASSERIFLHGARRLGAAAERQTGSSGRASESRDLLSGIASDAAASSTSQAKVKREQR